MIYDVDYFIRKFDSIPEHLWTTGTVGNSDGPRCANGHCMGDDHDAFTEETAGLYKVFLPLKVHFLGTWQGGRELVEYTTGPFKGRYSYKADRINNGLVEEYQQATPKERILAALRDIKKMQQPPVKERTTYVVVSESVLKDAKKKFEETILS
jgi:hypothetical protein